MGLFGDRKKRKHWDDDIDQAGDALKRAWRGLRGTPPPETKACEYCRSTIDYQARVCPHCERDQSWPAR